MASIVFSSAPFGKPGSDDFRQIGTVNTLPNGLVTVQWAPTPADGKVPINPQTILSVQPDGSYETRALTAVGAYEQFRLDGGSLTVRPNWDGNGPIFPLAPTLAYVIAARAL